MDKYGVELDDEMVKTSSKGSTCPKCGKTLKQPQYCESCGTEPWERRPEPEPEPKK